MEKSTGHRREPANSKSRPSSPKLVSGKKSFFESPLIGLDSPTSSSSSSSSPSSSSASKVGSGRKWPGGGGQLQPPKCQVEGCGVDLSYMKPYYPRHKVCGDHSKTSKVIVGGMEQRFCQQCSRFHNLSEFDQGKRSCRRRLAGHNERRRKPQPVRSSRLCPLSKNSSSSSFTLDFASYGNQTAKDLWATSSSASHPWLQNCSSSLHLQGDSGRAFSLLSNQEWGADQTTSSKTIASYHDASLADMVTPEPEANQGSTVFDLPNHNQFPGDYEASNQHIHWSL